MTVEDFRTRRKEALWAKFQDPRGNQLTSAEMLDFLVMTAESVMPYMPADEADELRGQLASLLVEDEARVAASEAVHQRTIRVCEIVHNVTSDVPMSPPHGGAV